jgi:hypothetical protein
MSVNANFSYPIGSTVSSPTPSLFGYISAVAGGVASLVTTPGGSTPLNAGTTISRAARCSTPPTTRRGAGVYHRGRPRRTDRAVPVRADRPIRDPDHAPSQHRGAGRPGAFRRQHVQSTRRITDDRAVPHRDRVRGGAARHRLPPVERARQVAAHKAVRRSVRDEVLPDRGRHRPLAGLTQLGIIGGVLEDVRVYGHDGNHYGDIMDSQELCRSRGSGPTAAAACGSARTR